MTIARFPQTQIYASDSKIIVFSAHVGEETIRCSISLDALQDHCRADPLTPLQAFICNRSLIEHIAERLVSQQRFDFDRSVLINLYMPLMLELLMMNAEGNDS
jgi:hypothetical protein